MINSSQLLEFSNLILALFLSSYRATKNKQLHVFIVCWFTLFGEIFVRIKNLKTHTEVFIDTQSLCVFLMFVSSKMSDLDCTNL